MKLGVNIDHVATLRQARRAKVPDPIKAARICEEAGCDSIVCHLREDRRHINEADLRLLRKTVKTKLSEIVRNSPLMPSRPWTDVASMLNSGDPTIWNRASSANMTPIASTSPSTRAA